MFALSKFVDTLYIYIIISVVLDNNDQLIIIKS